MMRVSFISGLENLLESRVGSLNLAIVRQDFGGVHLV